MFLIANLCEVGWRAIRHFAKGEEFSNRYLWDFQSEFLELEFQSRGIVGFQFEKREFNSAPMRGEDGDLKL